MIFLSFILYWDHYNYKIKLYVTITYQLNNGNVCSICFTTWWRLSEQCLPTWNWARVLHRYWWIKIPVCLCHCRKRISRLICWKHLTHFTILSLKLTDIIITIIFLFQMDILWANLMIGTYLVQCFFFWFVYVCQNMVLMIEYVLIQITLGLYALSDSDLLDQNIDLIENC